MPYLSLYVHLVWSTYRRTPYLNSKELREKVWLHIKDNSFKKDIFIDTVNGYSDHCHCLVSLSSSQSIDKVVQLIKGESSFWINKNGLTKNKFKWQSEYFASSVSKTMLGRTRTYIMNQEEHHRKTSFAEEYDLFLSKHGFDSFG